MDDATRRAVATAREQFPDELPGGVDTAPVVFGFDGYLDRVREVVGDRTDPETYDRLDTLSGFRDRVDASVQAESSLSFEWLEAGQRTGGHTCHLARAFGTWDFAPSLVGMYGDPVRDAFETEFGDYDLVSLGDPGVTDAVEFDDGKLMLTEIGDTMDLDWGGLDEGFGHDALRDRLDGAALLGVGYWSETPDLPDILDGLAAMWDDIADPPGTVLVDPGDVRKLDTERLRAGRAAIGRLAAETDVVVSANRAETGVLADAFDGESERSFEEAARAAFDALDPTWFVGHGIDRSVVVTADSTDAVAVPAVDDPELTTSSGDHFNAGLALGALTGLDPAASVVVGNAVAGHFVRTADQPSLAEIRAFLDEYLSKF
jgi:sugar/nucleoside kinase (ribokinase family)